MIACGMYHSLLINPDGQVLATGRNRYGQLGLGHTEDQESFSVIRGVPCAVQVSACGHNSAILDHQGDVWMFGSNEKSQTGIEVDESQTGIEVDESQPYFFVSNPTKIQNLPKIMFVCCGSHHSIVFDIMGYIWGAGDNSEGQLSIEGKDNINEFTRIDTPHEMGRVVNISCGSRHTILQSETGLWGTGNNYIGSLGIGHELKVTRFTRIPLEGDFQVQSSKCGLLHTIVLDTNGGVWATGYGAYGQLGLGKCVNKNLLTKILNIPPMVHIACGIHGTMMIESNGKLYVCGSNESKQLGIEGNTENILSPQVVADLPIINEGCPSFRFSLLIDDKGGVWASGNNTFGQLGSDHKRKPSKFYQVERIRAQVLSQKRFHNTKRART